MKNKKILIIAIISLIIISLLIVLLFFLINKKEPIEIEEEEDTINTQELEGEFSELFNNPENEYVSILYDIQKDNPGKYKITAQIPFVYFNSLTGNNVLEKRATEMCEDINKQINDIFSETVVDIYENSTTYTIIQIKYACSINDNILSLAIKCVLKEGTNAQRTIIKTFNYNLDNYTQLYVTDLVPEEQQEKLQKEINQKIHKEVEKEKRIAEQGYNTYRRNENSDMYLLENATEFYINNNILYIIYSYGNSNYTSTVDLIITKI